MATTVARFQPGRVVISAALHFALDEEESVLVAGLLNRHLAGDWGDLDDLDRMMNEAAIKDGSRIVSAYNEVIPGVDVYVITDAVSDVCPACWAGIGECEPDKGSWQSGTHFRDDLPPRRLATTVMRKEDY